MTVKIKIPESIEKAEGRLVALDGIATATGWERAAIVYAFTYDAPRGGGSNRNAPNGALTIAAFAALKIKGLIKRDNVAYYRQCWKDAITSGEAQDIKPGDPVLLPSSVFPPQERNQGSRPTAANIGKQMASDPALLDAAVEAAAQIAPAVVARQVTKPAVAQAAVRDPDSHRAIMASREAVLAERAASSKMPRPKHIDPDDEPEKPLSVLELLALNTKFTIIAGDAADVREAHDLIKQMQKYLTDEQRQDLIEWAQAPIDAWGIIRELLAGDGATDEALEALINQAQGES